MDKVKIDNFINKELTKKIKDVLVMKNDDGSYDLFGRYKIIINDQGLYVVEIIDKYEKFDNILFSSLKHAVTWCVFDKNNKFKDLKKIAELDTEIGSLDVSIAQHKKLAEKSQDTELKDIYIAKLTEAKLKKRAKMSEIKSYIDISKFMQNKQFKENSTR